MPAYLSTSEAPAPSLALKYLAAAPPLPPIALVPFKYTNEEQRRPCFSVTAAAAKSARRRVMPLACELALLLTRLFYLRGRSVVKLGRFSTALSNQIYHTKCRLKIVPNLHIRGNNLLTNVEGRNKRASKGCFK